MDRIGMKNYEDHGWQENNSPECASPEKGKRDVKMIVEYLKGAVGEVLNNA
jgi:hypothetical protein